MSVTYNTIYTMQEQGEIALTQMREIEGLSPQAIEAMDEALVLLEEVMGFIAEIESWGE